MAATQEGATRVTNPHDTVTCEAEALVTVTDSILPTTRDDAGRRRGLPGYTLEHAPGKLWRSRYDGEQNVIIVNSGHRDYIYAARTRMSTSTGPHDGSGTSAHSRAPGFGATLRIAFTRHLVRSGV